MLRIDPAWRRPTLPRLETQYHRRGGVSRPSSGWDRVGDPRHGHQAGAMRVGVFSGERWLIKPFERLVPVSFTCCHASTPGLSTWWSSTVLMRDLVLRGASRLDAFSGYPFRT